MTQTRSLSQPSDLPLLPCTGTSMILLRSGHTAAEAEFAAVLASEYRRQFPDLTVVSVVTRCSACHPHPRREDTSTFSGVRVHIEGQVDHPSGLSRLRWRMRRSVHSGNASELLSEVASQRGRHLVVWSQAMCPCSAVPVVDVAANCAMLLQPIVLEGDTLGLTVAQRPQGADYFPYQRLVENCRSRPVQG